MTVVSSKEFATNHDKYLELALNERIFIRKGIHTFSVAYADEDEDDFELLALAKERRNNNDRELVNVDELINYLRR